MLDFYVIKYKGKKLKAYKTPISKVDLRNLCIEENEFIIHDVANGKLQYCNINEDLNPVINEFRFPELTFLNIGKGFAFLLGAIYTIKVLRFTNSVSKKAKDFTSYDEKKIKDQLKNYKDMFSWESNGSGAPKDTAPSKGTMPNGWKIEDSRK